jgi:hypothetical protein
MREESIEDLQARIAAIKAKIAAAEGSSSPVETSNETHAIIKPKLSVKQVSAKSDPRNVAIHYAKPKGGDVIPTPLKSQNQDVDYSYAKDGSLYYTDKLEKKRDVWEKPAWAMGNRPLKTSELSEKIRSGEDLARPITFFNGRDESETAEANGMIVNLSGSGNRIKPVDNKIEWQKPGWTEKVNLRGTKNGALPTKGQEIVKPIGGISQPRATSRS